MKETLWRFGAVLVSLVAFEFVFFITDIIERMFGSGGTIVAEGFAGYISGGLATFAALAVCSHVSKNDRVSSIMFLGAILLVHGASFAFGVSITAPPLDLYVANSLGLFGGVLTAAYVLRDFVQGR